MSRGQVDREALEVKVRAMVTWKDPLEKIERTLILDGLPAAEAKQIVAKLARDRHAEVRIRGAGACGAGIVLLAIGWYFASDDEFFLRVLLGSDDDQALVIGALLGVAGLIAVVRGLIDLAVGARGAFDEDD